MPGPPARPGHALPLRVLRAPAEPAGPGPRHQDATGEQAAGPRPVRPRVGLHAPTGHHQQVDRRPDLQAGAGLDPDRAGAAGGFEDADLAPGDARVRAGRHHSRAGLTPGAVAQALFVPVHYPSADDALVALLRLAAVHSLVLRDLSIKAVDRPAPGVPVRVRAGDGTAPPH